MINKPLYDRINQLSVEQRKLLAKLLEKEGESDQNTPGQLIAYVTADTPVNIEDLIQHLGENLPDYMIPKHIIQLDNLPKLPNGKVDIRALPSPQRNATSREKKKDDFKQLENVLVKIWEEVLGFEPVGLNDNFFEIGGDSILSIQIVAKARAAGLNFAPNLLFRHQTIAELATAIEQSMNVAIEEEQPKKVQSRESQTSRGDISQEDMNQLMRQLNEQQNRNE